MPRFLALGCAMTAFAAAHAGTYNTYFDLPDRNLPFDTFGDPPASALAPAGVYRGLTDNTVLELRDGNLVASDPDGGAAGEYSALAVVAQPSGTTFDGGANVQATLSGMTLEDIRDGIYPGLAVGMTIVDQSGGTYFLAAINRTQAGSDSFDNLVAGGVTDRSQLVPGTGYFAVWGLNGTASGAVIASEPIPAGMLSDTVFRIVFTSGGLATFYVNQSPLVTGHVLPAQPDRAGLMVMSWGIPVGNPAYQDVTLGAFHASGAEVPDGGVPGIPMGAWMVCLLTLSLFAGTLIQLRQRPRTHPARIRYRGGLELGK